MSDSVFRAGGLASGMDTNSIVDQLVKLESAPIDQLRTRQSGLKTQISALGDLISRLSSLATAASDLGKSGALTVKSVSTNDAFSAVPGTDAVAGRYAVEVDALARAAKWRSARFTDGATHAGGTMTLTVQGTTLPAFHIGDGATLQDVADAIRGTGAPVSAVVLSDGTSSYLSVTARDTGVPASGDALKIDFIADQGVKGQLPGYGQTQAAQNASFQVDGLTFSRRSNVVSDAIPGTTLTLAKEGGPAEDLVLATDPDATEARLQKFVDAYNSIMGLVQRQLSPAKDTDRNSTLAGDTSVRALQAKLQGIVSTQVSDTGVRALADLGVKTARDGSLSIDGTTLAAALSRDPSGVNALFSKANTGIAAVVQTLVDRQTRAGDGVLISDKASLDRRVSDMDDQADALTRRVDAYRTNLIAQFTAMESTVSSLKSIGNFLTSQSQSQSK